MPDDRLLATCWTTAGDANPLPGDQRSPSPIRERVEAAAAAGFQGIGLLHADLMPPSISTGSTACGRCSTTTGSSILSSN